MRDSTREMIDVWDWEAVQARRPVLVAHRGGVIAPDAPENSLAAMRLAGVRGYDMVELDVRQARDGEPVLFHGLGGGSLFADCGVERVVEELTSLELTALCYRGSSEPIVTLEQALALCASLKLGVMLDIKAGPASGRYLDRIAHLLDKYALGRASVTISHDPLVRERLGDRVMFPVSDADLGRVLAGTETSLAGQYWFGWAARITDQGVRAMRQNGAFLLVSINTFHYPAHARETLAAQDVQRLLAAGADG